MRVPAWPGQEERRPRIVEQREDRVGLRVKRAAQVFEPHGKSRAEAGDVVAVKVHVEMRHVGETATGPGALGHGFGVPAG